MMEFDDLDPGEVSRQLCVTTNAYVDIFEVTIRQGGFTGDMLPALSKAADNLPDYLLGSDCPEVIHRMVVSIYLSLAKQDPTRENKRYESYVSTDEVLSAVSDTLENIIIDRSDEKYKDDAKYWTDDEYRFAKVSDEIEYEIYGDPLRACMDVMVEAIQEIEGLMSYDIDESGNICAIVAPVQCGIMKLFENGREENYE